MNGRQATHPKITLPTRAIATIRDATVIGLTTIAVKKVYLSAHSYLVPAHHALEHLIYDRVHPNYPDIINATRAMFSPSAFEDAVNESIAVNGVYDFHEVGETLADGLVEQLIASGVFHSNGTGVDFEAIRQVYVDVATSLLNETLETVVVIPNIKVMDMFFKPPPVGVKDPEWDKPILLGITVLYSY